MRHLLGPRLDAAAALQPCWEYVCECCEVSEARMGLLELASSSSPSPSPFGQAAPAREGGIANKQAVLAPSHSFMQSAYGVGKPSKARPSSLVMEPQEYKHVGYVLDGLIRLQAGWPMMTMTR